MTALYIDLETIPDESRSDHWGLTKLDELPGPGEFLGQSADTIKKWLQQYATVLPADYLAELYNYELMGTKSRITVLDAITEAREAPGKLISEMSFDPDTLRVIAIGYAIDDQDPVILALDEYTEVSMLLHTWVAMANYKPWVGWNNLRFDIPAIVARSCLLGVSPTCRVDWRWYGNSQICDLMEILSLGGLRKWKGLKKVAPLYGIEVPVTEVDGSDIYSLYQANDWATIREYLESDIQVTRALHKKLQGYFL